MKLSKLFHWLYASLMFLPLFVIPIFAIYTRNESNTFEHNIELQVEQNKVVDFNQQFYEYGELVQPFSYNGTADNSRFLAYIGYGQLDVNSIYITRATIVNYTSDFAIQIHTSSWSSGSLSINLGLVPTGQFICKRGYPSRSTNESFVVDSLENVTGNYNIEFYFNFFNLTQMFGEGNEPTIEQFNQWYPNDYYNYTLSEKQLIKNYSIETLNNTDIGSQFLYSVYKPVNDYFNIKEWMNLGGLYDWFLLNIFNGSNSIVIPIIFNLIIYWLVVSFIWLIFDVLMYVPNMIHKMLDKARME